MCASGVEWRKLLLTSVDFSTFEPPLVVVEREVVVRFCSFEDAPDLRLLYLEEHGGSFLLAALPHFADEV